MNQSKPILVIVSIKPFTCHSFRQFVLGEIEYEWAVFTETASLNWNFRLGSSVYNTNTNKQTKTIKRKFSVENKINIYYILCFKLLTVLCIASCLIYLYIFNSIYSSIFLLSSYIYTIVCVVCVLTLLFVFVSFLPTLICICKILILAACLF